MAIWWWLAIFGGGLLLAVLVRQISVRRTVERGESPRREGFGSFVYYVLFDWLFNWL